MSDEIRYAPMSRRAQKYPHILFTDRLYLEKWFYDWCNEHNADVCPSNVFAWASIRGFLHDEKIIDLVDRKKYQEDVPKIDRFSLWIEEDYRGKIICPHCKAEFRDENWCIGDVWKFCPLCGHRNHVEGDRYGPQK